MLAELGSACNILYLYPLKDKLSEIILKKDTKDIVNKDIILILILLKINHILCFLEGRV